MPGPVFYGAVLYSYRGYSLNYQRYHIVNGIIWEPGTGERETQKGLSSRHTQLSGEDKHEHQ